MTVARKYDNYLSVRNATGIINQLNLCDFRRPRYNPDNRTPRKCNQESRIFFTIKVLSCSELNRLFHKPVASRVENQPQTGSCRTLELQTKYYIA